MSRLRAFGPKPYRRLGSHPLPVEETSPTVRWRPRRAPHLRWLNSSPGAAATTAAVAAAAAATVVVALEASSTTTAAAAAAATVARTLGGALRGGAAATGATTGLMAMALSTEMAHLVTT